MQTVAVLTHPLWFAMVAVAVMIVYEWRLTGGEAMALGRRLGAASGVVALGQLPSLTYILLTPISFRRALTDPTWAVDAMSVVSVTLTAVVLWAVWRAFDWGRIVPGGVVVLLGTIVPYAAIAGFWDISGHVTFNTALSVYLVSVDRRLLPLLFVPLLALVNRPYVGAHTWSQSIAGLVLGLTVAGGIVTFLFEDRSLRTRF